MLYNDRNIFTKIGNFLLNLLFYHGRLGEVEWHPESDNLADNDAYIIARSAEGSIIEIPFYVSNRWLANHLTHAHFMKATSMAILRLNSHDHEVRPFAYRLADSGSKIYTLMGRQEIKAEDLWPELDEQQQYDRERLRDEQRRRLEQMQVDTLGEFKGRLKSIDVAMGKADAPIFAYGQREPRDFFPKPAPVRATIVVSEEELFDPREFLEGHGVSTKMPTPSMKERASILSKFDLTLLKTWGKRTPQQAHAH